GQILAWNPSSQPTHLRRASKRDGEGVRSDVTDSDRHCARCQAVASTDRCEAHDARHSAPLGHGFARTLAEKKAVAPTTSGNIFPARGAGDLAQTIDYAIEYRKSRVFRGAGIKIFPALREREPLPCSAHAEPVTPRASEMPRSVGCLRGGSSA